MFQRSASAEHINQEKRGAEINIHEIYDNLRGSLDPEQQHSAEEKLSQLDKRVGFSSSLLRVIMLVDDKTTCLVGAIYLKKLVNNYWYNTGREIGISPPFIIPKKDRELIRDSIVEAVVRTADPVRSQLAVCLHTIVRHDFPDLCGHIISQIAYHLDSLDPSTWSGALLCLYQLHKVLRYNKTDRQLINDITKETLPKVYRVCMSILSDQREGSVYMQKLILKIFFTIIQNSLDMEIITQKIFTQWMEVFWTIVDRNIPEHANTESEEDRANLPWWKCKKWALHILLRIFQKYGSPGNVTKDYNQFAQWYLNTFSTAIVGVLLKLLDQYSKRQYVSPQVLIKCLQYMNQGVGHAFWWELLEPRMSTILQEVLLPMLSYTRADDGLWSLDPHEYIKDKFDMSDDILTPVIAARIFLHTVCMRRIAMLEKTIKFIIQILNSKTSRPCDKDGALYMVGLLSDQSAMKQRIEDFLCEYVFQEFVNPVGHLRARACWIVERFSEVKFTRELVLGKAVRLLTIALLSDPDMPVKAEAAFALHGLLIFQENVEPYLETNIKEITVELLNLICVVKIDLTSVLQTVVYVYTEKLYPLVFEMCQKLSTTFIQALEGVANQNVNANVLLDTLSTMVLVMKTRSDIMIQIQPIILNLTSVIYERNASEFYKEALNLVNEVSRVHVSADMWKTLDIIYDKWRRKELDCFPDIMPVLYNFITVDNATFLSNENHILYVYNMCKSVLTSNVGEAFELYAAKLLEVIILQCAGHIDACLPSIVELSLQRLVRDTNSTELRTMCLQVAIAALYYNPKLLFEILEHLQLGSAPAEPLTTRFIRHWIRDSRYFCGYHDRKICALGLCILIGWSGTRPAAVTECSSQILPAVLRLLRALSKMGLARTSDSPDSKKRFFMNYINVLRNDGDKFDDGDDEETDLEKFRTPLDEDVSEFAVLKSALRTASEGDPTWYEALTCDLTTTQHDCLQQMLLLADKTAGSPQRGL